MKVHIRAGRLTKANFYRHLGARIRHYRKERGVTQATLAKVLGLGPDHVSHIEHGRRRVNLEQALQIATALGVELAELVSFRKGRR